MNIRDTTTVVNKQGYEYKKHEAEDRQGGRDERPRRWQELPDHMIADRCQGAEQKGCVQFSHSTGQRI